MENEEKKELLHIADISCHAIFKTVPSKYLHIVGLFIGKINIASYCIDGCSSQSDPKKYLVTSSLPTIKDTIGRFETEEECRQVCIQVARIFCQQLQ